jgi:hypothetical protein
MWCRCKHKGPPFLLQTVQDSLKVYVSQDSDEFTALSPAENGEHDDIANMI